MAQCQLGLVIILMFHFCSADDTTPGTTEDPECSVQDHCTVTEACINGKCVDPCIGTCGHNTSCTVSNHIPACACKENYTGNPFLGCSLQEDVADHPECSSHDHCPSTKACLMGKCADPCEGLCGYNTTCTVRYHVPSCSCKERHIGDPFIGCSQQADIPAPNLPECSAHDQCPTTKACIRGKCDDPCDDLCGYNTVCTVRNHVPACSFKVDHTGDPFSTCFRQGDKSNKQNKNFYLIKKRVSWIYAEDYCHRRGWYFASVNSKEEEDEMNAALKDQGFNEYNTVWLSGKRYFDENGTSQFYWSGSGKPMKYKNWSRDGLRNDEDYNCVYMYNGRSYEGSYVAWGLGKCRTGSIRMIACQDIKDVSFCQ